MAKLLLDKGADVNAQDEKGNTPLMAAAAINNAELCRLLLDKGAVVTLANKAGAALLGCLLVCSPSATAACSTARPRWMSL